MCPCVRYVKRLSVAGVGRYLKGQRAGSIASTCDTPDFEVNPTCSPLWEWRHDWRPNLKPVPGVWCVCSVDDKDQWGDNWNDRGVVVGDIATFCITPSPRGFHWLFCCLHHAYASGYHLDDLVNRWLSSFLCTDAHCWQESSSVRLDANHVLAKTCTVHWVQCHRRVKNTVT